MNLAELSGVTYCKSHKENTKFIMHVLAQISLFLGVVPYSWRSWNFCQVVPHDSDTLLREFKMCCVAVLIYNVILCWVDHASRIIWIITNSMHCLSSVYWVITPLHVLGISAAHHQEVWVYICGKWYSLYFCIDCQWARPADSLLRIITSTQPTTNQPNIWGRRLAQSASRRPSFCIAIPALIALLAQ
jgi:hypothetical protein